MKKTRLIFIIILLLASCNQPKNLDVKEKELTPGNGVAKEQVKNQEEPWIDCSPLNYKTVQQQADSLTTYYRKAKAAESNARNERLFFCAFPSSFKNMQQLFGYDDTKGSAPLYDYQIGPDIIVYFQNLTTIPKEEYYEKYISICIDGVWEADNISDAFGLEEKLLNDGKATCAILSKHTDAEISSVFRFIFDGPHPDHELNQELFRKLLPKVTEQNKRLGVLLAASYNKLLSEDDGHGH